MKEANFRRIVIKYLREQEGVYVIPAEGLARGTSDLLVNYHGRFVAIELKGSNNKYYSATDAQKTFLRKNQKCGGISMVLVHSKKWKEKLENLLSERETQQFPESDVMDVINL